MAGRQTRSKGAYGYVHARYIHNRSQKTGRPVTRGLKRLLYYNVYGNQENNPSGRPRGQIYDQDGREVGYARYKAWALQQSEAHKYSYRIIISPKGHLLADEDFVMALAAAAVTTNLANEFQLIVHRDTDHTHAHLLFFTDKTIGKGDLEQWKTALRQELMTREQLRAQEKGVSLPEVDKTDDDTTTPQTKKRTRRRRRGKRKERGLEM
ncbi:MAG: hypothetical protein KDE51_23820 [Anaerolineales bacterium]|nr:hypothetical protein [Anaerolineales bacterium]